MKMFIVKKIKTSDHFFFTKQCCPLSMFLYVIKTQTLFGTINQEDLKGVTILNGDIKKCILSGQYYMLIQNNESCVSFIMKYFKI